MADDGNAVLLSSAGVTEGVQVSLHPLPLLNISEHYTRVRVQEGREDVKGGQVYRYLKPAMLIY